MRNKQPFPKWFIDSVVDDNIRKAVITRNISSRETIQFRCEHGHIFSRRIDNYISLSTMDRKSECPICLKNNKRKYPQEFIDALLYDEDKKKAIEGSLKSTDSVWLKCSCGHITNVLVCSKVNLSSGLILGNLCGICARESTIIQNRIANKRSFPEWFIDALLYDEDKKKAIEGSLSSEDELYFKCPNGHITRSLLSNKIRLSDMTPKNSLCSECSRIDSKIKRERTLLEKRVYPQWFIDELVYEEDKNKALLHTLSGTDVVTFRCSKGHVYSKQVNQRINLDGTSNYGCLDCAKELRRVINTQVVEYPSWLIDELVDESDKELALKGILSVKKKVKIKCPTCGFIYHRRIHLEMDVQTKERIRLCTRCRLRNKKNSPIYTKIDYPAWFLDILVSDEDKEKAKSKMLRAMDEVEYRCPNGHINSSKVYKLLKRCTGEPRKLICKECARRITPIKREITMSKKRIFPQWFIDDLYYEEDKIKAKQKHLNTESIVSFKCPLGHIYKQRVGNHLHVLTGRKGKGCPICFSKNLRSQQEIEIDLYIQSLGFQTEHRRFRNPFNSRSRFEIDIYIPNKNIGIEYNGCFWHKTLPKDKHSRERMYHQKKYIACKELGIKLISIFEPDWKYRKEKIKQYLKDMLVPVQEKIYARECTLEKIDRNMANDMYEKYHLLGSTGVQQVSYGLFYKGSLTASMSFQKGRYTENKNPVWCLTRFVTVSGMCVIGGASKLLRAFEREYKPSLLISYSDNDFFSGGVYSKLGFEDKGVTNSPRYFWWLDGKEMKREMCQLRHLSKNYPELYKEAQGYDGNKEDYIMLALGGEKVYRAGHTKWEKKYVW